MPKFLLVPLLMLSSFVFGQSPAVQNNLKVLVNGDTLPSAWGGGMNAPQYSAADLNADGIRDLVVFDRDDNTFRTYINQGLNRQVSYRYAPAYEAAFDSCGCEDWALLIDYDCDQREDIFCGNNSNIDVYRQVEKNGKPFFRKTYTRLTSFYLNSGILNIYSGKIDLPAVVDVDNDGDLDFFSWKLGFNNLEFHRNIAQDSFGRCDTLVFQEETSCWGHFSESTNDNSIDLHDTIFCRLGDFSPASCRRGSRPLAVPEEPASRRHFGSTTLLLDLDGDQVKEALIGDVSYSNIHAVFNCGRLDYAYMDSVDDDFPGYDTPIDMEIFPACYFVDIDNDEVRDLVVATNYDEASENFNSVLWYRNEGMDDFPDFSFKGTGPLQRDNLDFGSGATPVFMDLNADGRLDLLVGNAGYYNRSNGGLDYALAYLENVGNSDQPVFRLADRNYLGITGGPWPGLARITPAAGDLDGDGDLDLLLGTSTGNLYYFRNVAAPGNPANFIFITDQFEAIDVGTNAAPFLYDFDNDNDLDLFVGNEIGKIAFYRNTGSAQSPAFTIVNDEFGKIRVLDQFGGRFSGNAKPFVEDYDSDGTDELLVGSVTGFVEIYEDLVRGLTDSLPKQGNLFDYSAGLYASLAMARLDSTGAWTYLLGNSRGGLQLINSLPAAPDITTGLHDEKWSEGEVRIFPNPSTGIFSIEFSGQPFSRGMQLQVLDPLGRQLMTLPVTTPQFQLDLRGQPSGLYFLRFVSGKGQLVKKILLTSP